MSKIEREINHSLGLDQAKEVIGKIVTEVQSTYPKLVKKITWNSDNTAADVKGTGFDGKFSTTANQSNISLKLGLLARPLKGKIEGEIEKWVEKYYS